jgi:hypothetical protein
MSIAISRIGLFSVLAAVTALACGSGENTRGFADPVEGGYQSPSVGEENGSQPPNNLLACQPQSGCQSCETPCDLCACRAEGNQLSENEYLVCVTSPNCIAAIREFAGVEAGTNNLPDAQFLGTGDEIRDDQRECAQLADQTCAYCQCLDVGDCSAVCSAD